MEGDSAPGLRRSSTRRKHAPCLKLKAEDGGSSKSLDSASPSKRRSHLDAVRYMDDGCRRCSVQSDVVRNGHRKLVNGKRCQKVKRSASAVAPQEGRQRKPVRRTSSEISRTKDFGGSRRGKRHRNNKGNETCTSVRKSVSRSTVASEVECDVKGRQTSLADLCAVEAGVGVARHEEAIKEGRRRRVVFVVVLVALALLTASVLLVGITLFMSPSVDEVLRKENENLFRLPTSTTVLTTAAPSTALPDNGTSLTAAG